MPIKLIDTHEDAVNIHLPKSLEYRLPFGLLGSYYRGEIHRPPGCVGEGVPDDKSVGHHILSITGMFGAGEPAPPFDQGIWIGNHKYECEEVLGMHMRADRDQEMLICGVESLNGQRPFPSLVRNFTEMTDLKVPVLGHGQVARFHGCSTAGARRSPPTCRRWRPAGATPRARSR